MTETGENNSAVMNDVLTELGWNTGVHLPVATTENLELQKELERLIHARATASARLIQVRSKRQELENHNKHLSQEQVQIASLLSTQRGSQSAENDQIKVFEMEGAKLSQDIREFQKTEQNINDREKTLESNMCTVFNRLEELKRLVSYDTDAIRLWEDSLLKTEEDNAIIKKFSLQDQNKAKDLELQRQKLHKEMETRNRTLEKVVIEIKGLEVALNKSHSMYLDAKKDRANLLNQWREAVSRLRQRHKDIHLMNLEIEKLREAIAKKIEDTEEQKTFYLNEVNNNRETEKQLEDLTKEASKARENLHLLINKVRDYQSEIRVGKHELTSLSNSLDQARAKSKQIEIEMLEKNKRLHETMEINKNLIDKLGNLKNKKMTSNERANELEKMVENNKSIVNALTVEIERLQAQTYRSTQMLNKLHDIDSTNKINLRGVQLGIEILEKNEKTLDKEIQKAKEIVYDFDFNILHMESKIDYIKGAAVDTFSEELEEQVKELSKVLTEKNNTKQMLSKQISTIQDDIRRLGQQVSNDNIELANLQDALHREIKMVEGGKRQVKAGQIRSQEKQVEENILRLRVMQAQRNLDNIDNSLYTLEKQRIEMETAMKERQLEIGVEKDVLALRKRNLLEDKSNIRGEIQERLLRNEQYKKRFEYQVSLLGTDDDGHPLSPTYFKIKTTQDRVMLQQEGDEWDLKVKQAEQEIVAMENTLKLVNISNDKFKTSLCTIEETGPEEEEFKNIQQEYYCMLKKLSGFRKKKLNCAQAIERTSSELKTVQAALEELAAKKSSIENSIKICVKDLDVQEDRLSRAKRALTKVSAKVRSGSRNPVFEKEMKVRSLTYANQNTLQQLLELNIKHLETSPVITRLCDYYHVSLPGENKYKSMPKRVSQISILELTGINRSASSISTTSSVYTSNNNAQQLVPTTPESQGTFISTTSIHFTGEGFLTESLLNTEMMTQYSKK